MQCSRKKSLKSASVKIRKTLTWKSHNSCDQYEKKSQNIPRALYVPKSVHSTCSKARSELNVYKQKSKPLGRAELSFHTENASRFI